MKDSTLNQKIKQISSTWTKEDKSSIPTQEGTPFPAMPEISVTNEGVLKRLLNSTPTKQRDARIMKDACMAKEIAPILTTIFQRSFDTRIVPTDWRTANVTTIFKKAGSISYLIIDQSLSPVFVAISSPAMFSNTWTNTIFSSIASTG